MVTYKGICFICGKDADDYFVNIKRDKNDGEIYLHLDYFFFCCGVESSYKILVKYDGDFDNPTAHDSIEVDENTYVPAPFGIIKKVDSKLNPPSVCKYTHKDDEC